MLERTSAWFVRPVRRPEAALRLFCVPFAGVGPSAYRGWAQSAGPGLEVVGVHLPGREGRYGDRPIASMEEIVRSLVEAMTPWLNRPFALLGHSLGGLIAFEPARALRAAQLPTPEYLFISASRAPHLPYPHPPLRGLPDAELLQAVNVRYGGTIPAQVLESQELRDLFVPAVRADLTALETYSFNAAPPIDCSISVFGGVHDETLPQSALNAWAVHTNGEFRVRLLSEGHLFLQAGRDALLEAIHSDLGEHQLRRKAAGE